MTALNDYCIITATQKIRSTEFKMLCGIPVNLPIRRGKCLFSIFLKVWERNAVGKIKIS